jgi:hypothetical protein
MAWASQSGRARINARKPSAFAVCMRCGIWYNRVDLNFQWDWAGAQLQNKYLLVCSHCLDIPQEQLRAIVLPADPVPVYFPSVENFVQDETEYHTTSAAPVTDPITGIPVPAQTLLVTENCQNLTQQPSGAPAGLEAQAVMPWNGIGQYAVALPVISMSGNGTAIVTVTCSAVHNLQTNAQIAVSGSNPVTGFYSVIVTSATAFTFQTTLTQANESLLSSDTTIITASVGIPYGYEQIP